MKRILIVLLIFSSSAFLFSQEIMLSKNQLKFLYDTLYTGYLIPAKRDSITFYNVGSKSLLIDSLYTKLYGYTIDIFSKDTSFNYFAYRNGYSLFRLSIKSADSAKLVFHYPSFCPICKKSDITAFNDQLTIHSNSITNGLSYIAVQGDGSTQVNDDNVSLNSFTLYQNYPNPFNPSTIIKVSIGFSCNVSIIIFNVMGQEVTHLFKGQLIKGNYNFIWTSDKIPAGIYYCRMTSGTYSMTIKLVLLK